MNTEDLTTDARPAYLATIAWLTDLIEGIRPDQWTEPTPCDDWDVRTLVAHIVATVDRITVIGRGEEPFSVPSILQPVPDDAWRARLDAGLRGWHEVWDDAAVLDRPATMPWGSAVGRVAIIGYVQETLVHCWDLALATGQSDAGNEDIESVAVALLPLSQQMMAADRRGEGIPFDAPVMPREDAHAVERVANWLGHTR